MGAYSYKKKKQRGRKLLAYIFLFIIIILCLVFTYAWKSEIEPNLEDIARLKARAMLNQVISETIREEFTDETQVSNLLVIKTNDQGNVEMVQSNTQEMNILVGHISKSLQKRYAALDAYNLDVPIGSVLGSRIFSQTGPGVDIKVLPMSVSSLDFKTEFETQGINQTKYKVYAVLETDARVIAPFSANNIQISNTILIAEAVIIGKVPQSYVVVPENEILDGMDL